MVLYTNTSNNCWCYLEMQALSVNNMKICKLDFANDSMLRGTDTMQNLNSRGDGSRQSGRVHVNADNFKVTAAKE